MFNPEDIKKDFPIFNRKVNGKDLVYLDNAAMSQTPSQVVEAISNFYFKHNSNVHRGVHTLSEESTDLFEESRKKVAHFIGARIPEEVIFTSGTTEAINIVANSWALSNLKKGDKILLTYVEHHSNLVPWQQLAKKMSLDLVYSQVTEDGLLTENAVEKAFSEHSNIRLAVIAHVSNVMGTVAPVKGIVSIAHENNAFVLVDGAQAVPHLRVNMQSLGCDFYVFSGHKMLGPTGIGVLWGRKELLDLMPPIDYGGGMIKEVTLGDSSWAPVPEKFEAGTPNVAGAIGLGAAVEYLSELGMESISKHSLELSTYSLEKLFSIDKVRVLGPLNAEKRVGLISFIIEGIHAHDVASVLSTEGVAVRSGHHCTMPLHEKLEIPASVRMSYYLYNTKHDIDVLIMGIKKAIQILT